MSRDFIDVILKCVELNPYFRYSTKELLKTPLIKECNKRELDGIKEKENRPTKIKLDVDSMGFHGSGDNA